jgi:hypothetical protein
VVAQLEKLEQLDQKENSEEEEEGGDAGNISTSLFVEAGCRPDLPMLTEAPCLALLLAASVLLILFPNHKFFL